MNRPPTSRIVALGLLGLFVAIIGYQLISGSTRLVVAAGSSMEPIVESGDLIVVREQGSYAIGDLVAFQSAKIGTVLHRIVDTVERDGELRFVTQGDNNDFLDSDQPLESAILGTSALILPNAGRFLSLVPILGAALIAAYWIFGSKDASASQPAGPATLLSVRQLIGWALCGVAAITGVVAVARSSTEPSARNETHETTTDLNWSGEVSPSVVYPDGVIDRDDPVFLSEVNVVEISASVALDERLTDTAGTSVIEAVISDDSGWNYQIDLASEPIDDGQSTAVGVLALDELRDRLDEVAERTGYRSSRYELSIFVRSQIEGELSGRRIDEDVIHETTMVLDAVSLSSTDKESWTSVTAGSVTVQETKPAQFELVGFALSVAAMRIVAAIGVLVGLLLALWPRRGMAEHEVINRHFGSLVVSVGRVDIPANVSTVKVESFSDLLRLAQIEASPILHVEGVTHEWVTSALGVWYRFVLVNAAITDATESGLGSAAVPLWLTPEVTVEVSEASATHGS